MGATHGQEVKFVKVNSFEREITSSNIEITSSNIDFLWLDTKTEIELPSQYLYYVG